MGFEVAYSIAKSKNLLLLPGKPVKMFK